MPEIDLRLEGDGIWPDLKDKILLEIRASMTQLPPLTGDLVLLWGQKAPPWRMAALAHGTARGRPSVALRLDLPGGTAIIAETTLNLFLDVADALKARYGDPREG